MKSLGKMKVQVLPVGFDEIESDGSRRVHNGLSELMVRVKSLVENSLPLVRDLDEIVIEITTKN